jgi:lysophospholipase L1-like esterase
VTARTLAIVAALAAVGLVALRSGEPETWRIRNDRPAASGPIVCFGDSLTFGHGAEPDESYPAVLGRLLGRRVVNRGRNGDTSVAAVDRLGEVLDLHPAVVVMTLGGNDMLQRLPIPATVQAMTTIFDRLTAAGVMVVFLGIDPPFTSAARMDAIRALCREHGVLWFGDAMDGLWGDRARMSDQIHPNAAGYRVMAERVASALRAHL